MDYNQNDNAIRDLLTSFFTAGSLSYFVKVKPRGILLRERERILANLR
jgi:hypothetical protein